MVGYGPNKGLVPKLSESLFQDIRGNLQTRQCQVNYVCVCVLAFCYIVSVCVCYISVLTLIFTSTQVFFSMLEIYNEQVRSAVISSHVLSFPSLIILFFRLCRARPGARPAGSGVSFIRGSQGQGGAAERLLRGGITNSPVRKCSTGTERKMNSSTIKCGDESKR